MRIICALLTILFVQAFSYGQLMTFEFSALLGGEATAASNFNDPNISAGTISRGAGLTAAANAGRFNATNWSILSIPDAVANNKYMEFTITPDPGCSFSVSSVVVQLQRSGAGPSAIALRSSADGYATNLDAIYPIVDNTGTQTFTFTFTQSGIAIPTTYRFYMFAESTLGSGGPGDGGGDDITVNGTTSCSGSNTITTGTVFTPPFSVDCAGPNATGSVDFTSTGLFVLGNTYTAQLSNSSGSFASPVNIGSIVSIANFGSIPISIPATTVTGSGYLIRVISDGPGVTGTSSAAFTITQTGTCGPTLPASEGLIINEWSNGPTGNQEFYEFVVAGQCGTLVDIRGYILDDNNATFTNPADYDATASGIAPGHFRFTTAAQWASIPVGSLIVVYNADEPNPAVPADDPTDANNDSLYVVPHTSTLFERCTTFPASTSPDSVYTGCTYGTAPLGGWAPLSLRNAGDAIQVRHPNGNYYHGVSYGGTEMTGGPHNLKLFTGSGTAMCGWFTDGDFFDIANWSSGPTGVNETPGLPNNALNLAWLRLMRDPLAATCPIVVLPVELIEFNGLALEEGNRLWWSTATETNSSHFVIERSHDGVYWRAIAQVPAAGFSIGSMQYSTIDQDFEFEMNYYRLTQFDTNGESTVYSRLVAIDNSKGNAARVVARYNMMGQEVDALFTGIQILLFEDGHTEKVMNF